MAAAAARPLLGVLGPVCDVTARVAEREVARQGQVAPDYERWILQALSDSSPHWISSLELEPKCSASTSSISGIMQQFLSLCDTKSSRTSYTVTAAPAKKAPSTDPAAMPTRIPPLKASPVKRPCQEASPRGHPPSPGPAAFASRIPLPQVSPKRPCSAQESSPDALRSPGPAASASSIPVQASPAKRPCWQSSPENPPCSPGGHSTSATPSKELAASKRRTQDAASPIERIAQAPSPIRAMKFGALGVHDALPGGPVEAVPEDQEVVNSEKLDRMERPTLVFMPSSRAPAAPAAPAAFAQDSIIEPTEEVHVPRPAEWHSKALFEKPPDSPLRRPKPAPPRPAKPAAEPPQASPERKESERCTPKVADRIQMFEKIISPSVRCVPGAVAMSSSARLGKTALGSANRGSATCSNERSSGRAVDGSSLFTPVQPAWARPDVKPKELFRSNSDLALKPRCLKPELPKPRAKVAPHAPPSRKPTAQHAMPGRADKENVDSFHRPPELPNQKREALKPRKVEAPPVELKARVTPMYKDPALDLRTMTLPPKKAEDNYAISEYGDSEGEDVAEKDKLRQKKPVPKWCDGYFSGVQQQQGIDPDSIFGRVPRCVMDDVFPESLYQQVGRKRPARRRGSSGDWKRDRLTRNEIRSYKQRMGQKRSWDEPDLSPPA